MTRSRIVLELLFMNLVVTFLLVITHRVVGGESEQFEGLMDKSRDFTNMLDQTYKELIEQAN